MKKQVWPNQVQVGWFLPIIGGRCIHIWIQISSSDCHIQIFKPFTHWIQERNIFLSINNTNHGELTLWNTVGKTLSRRFRVPPHSILCSSSRWCWKAGTHCPTAPQIQDVKHFYHKHTYHWCEMKFDDPEDLICLQQAIWWSINVLCCYKTGLLWHMCRLIRHQYKSVNHEDISVQSRNA